MRDLVNLSGMVLSASPVGDYDRRLVILTRERGKITAFARGAKRSSSTLRAAASPFVAGTFSLAEGRDSYNLYSAEVDDYHSELAMDPEAVCYASYFSEFASYYGREGIEAGAVIDLLEAAFTAIREDRVPNIMVRRVYELRLMVLNGEYTETMPGGEYSDAARYAWYVSATRPVDNLFSFRLKDEPMREFGHAVDRNIARFVDRHFHSLDVLKVMV